MEERTRENTTDAVQIPFEEFLRTIYFVASSDYLLREIAGESILIPIGENPEHSNCMFSLNSTCAFLWKTFQNPRTIWEVVQESMEQYEAEEEEVVKDIYSFVVDYCRFGLLQETTP